MFVNECSQQKVDTLDFTLIPWDIPNENADESKEEKVELAHDTLSTTILAQSDTEPRSPKRRRIENCSESANELEYSDGKDSCSINSGFCLHSTLNEMKTNSHSAGFDAFATGFVGCVFERTHSTLWTEMKNKIYLPAKTFPLLIRRTPF